MDATLGEEAAEALRALLRRIRARLASEGASYELAHEIIMVEVVARNIGVYDELEDEIVEVKRVYAAIYAGEVLLPRRLHEQRFQRLKRGAWRAARVGRHGA